MNFKRHLYSPCSFQPGSVGPSWDRFPSHRRSAHRRTSYLSFSDPSLFELTYKLSNTSACSSNRARRTQSNFGLKSFISNKTQQSSLWMATHHSTHPLWNLYPTHLPYLLNPPPRLQRFRPPGKLSGQRSCPSGDTISTFVAKWPR